MRLIDNKVEDEQTYLKQLSTPLQETSHYPSPPPTTTTTSPPSPSSSPTHEFSFAVSLHPLLPPTTTYDTNNNHKTNTTTTTTTLQPPSPPQPPAAIDLSPADDIFLHGHLLPLHYPIPHLPDSPRSSTNSMDSFTLPINLLYHHSNPIGNTSFHCHHHTTFSDSDEPDVTTTTTPTPPKPKPFSIFNIPKWKKRPDNEISTDEDQTKDRTTKKLKLDLSQLIKKYMKMVKPLLSFPKSTKRSNYSNSTRYKYNNHQSYSYSSNSLSRKQPVDMMSKVGRRRGQFSAPASMRASPANSGILLASGCVSPAKSTSESTMEELQAAIQAAIAHCKNSIAIEDKVHESQRS
ncbi:putative BKI1/putative membrane-associated kinase regulator/4 [Helianthus annuus]|uniref:BKI1/putative membrane-associated kinase regulator 1/3/4 n=1 Tax=Helianthus annuus TaxID=4232 RepID=A0A9K3J0R2_HELAN|nr:BRI1 kinase inhibitor 1-like [Helianthus annuus]KAF5806549.1 putative BKI1/putative membrane-associated kinase regulator 1/3/4 [Helianthus annuus]KAJ0570806.1 putative BKI1/putative membrane-associated kinase regulator/4 [Helianthus annuus]KAJ0577763.1 putative BKI1/putative membrane-associated kinase regulator/4 [Helianthus annuus]KAJ0585146.1 putative BKI1/putative membrane-associated kinase regulator/4 [Helianthus annuus]KAJ0747692.1 putative BKI1/putative membrane-associated kinase regu